MAEATEQLHEKISPNGSDGSSLSGLASKNKLIPVLATAAAAAAAGLAAQKGPDLLKKLTGEADEEAEELGEKSAEGVKKGLSSGGGPAGKLASKLMGGGGGGQKGGKTRRLPIQRWTDVAVPVDKAYRTWTQKGDTGSMLSSALSGGWEAARDALVPAAEDAAGAAGEYLAQNGPDFVRDRIVPRFIGSFNEARGES
jgi:hypothetical protein